MADQVKLGIRLETWLHHKLKIEAVARRVTLRELCIEYIVKGLGELNDIITDEGNQIQFTEESFLKWEDKDFDQIDTGDDQNDRECSQVDADTDDDQNENKSLIVLESDLEPRIEYGIHTGPKFGLHNPTQLMQSKMSSDTAINPSVCSIYDHKVDVTVGVVTCSRQDYPELRKILNHYAETKPIGILRSRGYFAKWIVLFDLKTECPLRNRDYVSEVILEMNWEYSEHPIHQLWIIIASKAKLYWAIDPEIQSRVITSIEKWSSYSASDL